MIFITENKGFNCDADLFSRMSIKTEVSAPVPKRTYFGNYLFANIINFDETRFVFINNVINKPAISQNQVAILNMAIDIFSNSTPLNTFEQEVLNSSFRKSILRNPTLKGRL